MDSIDENSGSEKQDFQRSREKSRLPFFLVHQHHMDLKAEFEHTHETSELGLRNYLIMTETSAFVLCD